MVPGPGDPGRFKGLDRYWGGKGCSDNKQADYILLASS